MTRVVVAWAALSAAVATAQGQEPHGALSPGLDCAACHSSRNWRVDLRTVSFDHNRSARYALEGRHRDAACRSCHLTLRFREPALEDAECATCHVDVHRGAFAEPCAQCHTPAGFQRVEALEVHSRTSFPLSGAHAGLACRACHEDDRAGAFTPVDPECLRCHQGDYATARPVDHQAAGFPTDCTQCHTTLAWSHAVRFDHVAASGGFALVGAHARLRCAFCHSETDMAPLYQAAGQNDCVACHQDEFQREHDSAYPETCLNCHTVERWTGATFNHAAATGFALVGAHARLACERCHAPDRTPLFQPADQDDCVACHDDDYQREHGGSGFPTTCRTCHTVDTWSGATFADHDRVFPISSGPHANRDCQDCHVQPGDFSVFSCFTCHDRAKTDEQHRERAGYSYDSNACYSCHPNGRS